METNTMTDSELLRYARDYTDKAIRNDDWLKFGLARFVADMLDDGPVTEEALDAFGFGPYNQYGYREHNVRKNMFWNRDFGYIALAGDDDDCTIMVKSIGQLRCLLRGLGVMT